METRSRARGAQTSVATDVSLEGPGPRSAINRSLEDEDLAIGALMDDRAGAAHLR